MRFLIHILIFSCLTIPLRTTVLGQQDTLFHYAFDGNLNDIGGREVKLTDVLGNGYKIESNGRFGQALSLNGSQYLTVAQNSLLDPAVSPYTVCAWVKNTSALNHNQEHIVLHQSKDENGAGASRYLLGLKTTSTGVPMAVGTFVGGAGRTSSRTILRNEWTHIAIVGNPSDQSFQFFINGQFDNSTTAANPFEASQGGFRVGGHISGNLAKSWVGLIDDLYLIKKALTQEEIIAVARLNLATANSDLSLDAFRMYPNPASTHVSIDLPSAKSTRIRVFSPTGKLVRDEYAVGQFHSLDIADLSNGLYTLQLSTDSEQTVVKFMKLD